MMMIIIIYKQINLVWLTGNIIFKKLLIIRLNKECMKT